MSSRKDNLKRTEETLRENEDKYKFLVDNSKEVILILNKRGKIIFANKSTLANYGYSEEELIGKSIAHFLARDCIKKALYALAQEFLGHPFPEMDIQFKTKSGEIRYLKVAAGSTSVYDKGKLIGLMVNASDVTEPRKTEEKLRESEKRFRELWDHAPVAYHTLDSKGIITSVNQTEAKMLGYAKEEMVGKPILEFILPEQHAEAEKRFQQKISGDPTLKAANRVYVSKDGSKIYVMIDDVLERNKDGDVIGIRTTMVDMTKDKEAEEALKRSEEHFRDLVEKAGIAISIDDREGDLTYFNERYAEIFGYSVEEMKKQSVRSLVHPDDIELVMLYHQERLQDKKVPSRYEFKGVRKDGSVIYLEVDVVVLREAGRLIGTRSYMWDITDRKRAEEVLQKRNTQLELIHQIQSEIPMNTDIETILLRAAESIGKSFGYYKISVNLYDPATNEIEYLTGWNKTGLPIPRGHRQKLGQGLIGKAGLLKQTIVANDVSKEPDYMPFHLTETKAELIIPLIVQDRLIGVLDVQATQVGAFSNEDVSVLEAIANYIARIIDGKQKEEALRKERDKAQKYLDIAGVMIAILDPSGKVTLINKKGCEILGYPEHEIIGKNWFDHFVPKRLGAKEKESYEKLKTRNMEWPEFREGIVQTKNEEERIILWHNTLLLDDGNSLSGILSSGEDITERKWAEEEIRLNERRLQTLFNISQDKSKDVQELIDYALDEAIKLTGSKVGWFGPYQEENRTLTIITWSKEVMKECEIPKKSLVFSLENAGIWAEGIRRRMPFIINDYQAPYLNKKGYPSGHVELFKFLTIPLFSGDKIVAAVAVANKEEDYDETDVRQLTLLMDSVLKISERKRAEEALVKSKKELTIRNRIAEIFLYFPEEDMYEEVLKVILNVMESRYGAFAYLDEDGAVVVPAMSKDIWSEDQLPDKSIRFPRETRGESVWAKALREKQSFYKNELGRVPSGHAPIENVLVVPILYHDNAIGYFMVANKKDGYDEGNKEELEMIASFVAPILNARLQRDSQERRRKTAEEALRESEERFRTLFENAPIGIYRTAPDGRILEANPSLIQMLGYSSSEELVARNLDSEGFEPDYPRSRFKELIERDGEIRGLERAWTKRDNSVIYVRENARAIRRDDGTILYYEGSVEDITERKRAEEELKNSEEMFKITFEYAPDALYLSDLKGNFVDGNKMAEKLTGYKREELIGKSFLKLKLLPLDHVPKAASLLAKNVMRKPTGPDEFVLKRKAGGDVWVEIRTYPVKIRGKTLVLGIARDITERKKAEKALLESERKLRFLAESTRDVVFVYDMNRRLQYVNPAVEEFTGYSIQEIYEQNFINYLHPEDQERMMKLWEELFQGKSFSGEEFRIVTKDGKIKWCSSSWGPLLDEKGNQIGIQGRELDITKRKLAEETLQKNETKYRALFECANDAVFLLDSEGKHVIVNKKAADMLGYDIKELIGLSYRDIIAPSEYKDAKNKIQAILEGESFSLHERTFRKKDGTEFPVEINLATIRDAEGRPLYVQRIVRDITERKRAENELKQTSNKLRQALGSIVKVVALTVEQRDPYTAGHQNRVANLARAIAIEMALSEDHIEGVYTAGIIHDIGKISAPAEILSKPSKLSEVEFSLIKEHAKIGYDILKEIEFPWPIAQIVYQHHERINGSGYPQGLSGEDILLEARILGVADAVEAMASHRPYRPAHGLKKALEEISKNRGILYDPGVVDACLKIFAKKKFKLDDKEMATSNTYEIKNPG